MAIKKITIEGLRGYSVKTDIEFAIPDKTNPGSGLTVLVGPNNSGKSTIIEAVHLVNSNTEIIPADMRNQMNNGNVSIIIEDKNDTLYKLESTEIGGAFVKRKHKLKNSIENDGIPYNALKTFVLSSKRTFNSTFGVHSILDRDNYKSNVSDSGYRDERNGNNNFGGRLLNIVKSSSTKNRFDNCLEKVLTPLPSWRIEAISGGNAYLEFTFNGVKHNSNGAGDGYINIFNIVDALYDSDEDNVIFIDEPEVSLHPELQRKLFDLLVESSKDKQIIVSTHSPFFVDWSLFAKYSKIIRLRKYEDTIKVFELSDSSKEGINSLLDDAHHPHILSLNANEIFFLKDNVILTEGQEDVLCYKNIFKQLEYVPDASFFGWGVGGADKFKFVLDILQDLGYEKVFVILDNDKRDTIQDYAEKYYLYSFYAIQADDVRNKERDKKLNNLIKIIDEEPIDDDVKMELKKYIEEKFPEKIGLVKGLGKYEINEEYRDSIQDLVKNIDEYFGSSIKPEKEEVNVQDIPELYETESESKEVSSLFEKWVEKNPIHEIIQKKYKEFEFSEGFGSTGDSVKKVSTNKYVICLEIGAGINSEMRVRMALIMKVNLKNKKVKLKKIYEIENTLPLSKFQKFIRRIFY